MQSAAITAVGTPRDRRMIASLRFCDGTAVVLRLYCGGGVVVQFHGGHGGAVAVVAVPRRSHCGLAQTAVALRTF